MSRLRLTLSALLVLAICVLAISAVLASEGLLQDPLQRTTFAILLALGGLIAVYFGWRGQQGGPRDRSIERGGVNTIETFWFVFWRMTLWVLCLLAAVGAVYGLVVGELTFPYGIGFMLTGPIFGTVSGLCVGPLEGVALWGVTMLHHRGGTPLDSDRYRRAAGVACAAVCIVALALIFELLARKSGTSFVSGPVYDSDDVTFLMIVIVAPSLSAAWAAWWAARRVAGQYARKIAAGSPLEER